MFDLSVILPVHNEVNSLGPLIEEWKRELDIFKINYQFVICEDGSTDGTKDLLKTLVASYPIVLNQKEFRRGYGKAVIDGITTASSKYVLCIDSDGQCDQKDFNRFWAERDSADILIGWRTDRKDVFIRKLYSGLFKRIFNFLFPNAIHDPSAPYVLFKRESIIGYVDYLRLLQEGFWWGFIATCLKKRLSISEIPINHRVRSSGGTRVFVIRKIPAIATRNILGLLRLRLSR